MVASATAGFRASDRVMVYPHISTCETAHMACISAGVCSGAEHPHPHPPAREQNSGKSKLYPSSSASLVKRECLCLHLSKTSTWWEFSLG